MTHPHNDDDDDPYWLPDPGEVWFYPTAPPPPDRTVYSDPRDPAVLYGPDGAVLLRVWDPVGFHRRD